jgi:hypothetical protein
MTLTAEERLLTRGDPAEEIVALKEFLADKISGIFIDIGAGEGVIDNKSFYLERGFDWTGICTEPSYRFTTLSSARQCITQNICIGCDTILNPNNTSIYVDDIDIVDKVNNLGEIMLKPCYKLEDILSANSIIIVDCLIINQRFANKIYHILRGINFGKVIINIFILPRTADTDEETKIKNTLNTLKYDVYKEETTYWIFVRQTRQFSFD